MRLEKNILAIIPARGGSKGLKKKNLRLLKNKPLISYTIKASLDSKFINKVVVSSEDSEIQDISKKNGAEIIPRPNNIALDESSTIDVLLHTLSYLSKNNYTSDIVILLQPTSPLRTSIDIDCALKIFFKKKCNSVISFVESEHSPYWNFKINNLDNSKIKPLFNYRYLHKRRQDLPRTIIPNGAIYIINTNFLKKNKSFYCKNIVPYIMNREHSIDIDNELDLKFCEFLLTKK